MARPRSRPLDGVTDAERRLPPGESRRLVALEQQVAAEAPAQLELFLPGPSGAFTPLLGGLAPLTPQSGLDVARGWYRKSLEGTSRPDNTVESYSYDLAVLEKLVGVKPIAAITRADIARFLGDANGRSTRKRRLTSVRRFFRYLIDDAKVLKEDPTDGYFPHAIALKSPVPLFADDQQALLDAAASDERWSLPAILLMMRLGLGRTELLALRREHIEMTDPVAPVIYVMYEDATKRGKERKLLADAMFATAYAAYLSEKGPADLVFPVGPQAVNGMVERVRKAAGLTQDVTPQTLRHTFAVDRARDGATEDDLIALLGLADDTRNRESVRRYLKLAAPPR